MKYETNKDSYKIRKRDKQKEKEILIRMYEKKYEILLIIES